jgi:hypothetical protein
MDGQADRQRGIEAVIHRETKRQRRRMLERCRGTETERQTDRKMVIWADRRADRQRLIDREAK